MNVSRTPGLFAVRLWLVCIVVFCACLVPVSRASAQSDAPSPPVARSYALPVTVPTQYNGDVRDLPPIFETRDYYLLLNEFESPPNRKRRGAGVSEGQPTPNLPLAPMPAPSSNFAGLGFGDSISGGTAGAGWPPDTNGDVGTNYYIQAVNDAWGIFDKTTGTRVAAFTENQLWSVSGTSTPCLANNTGDPVAIYDSLNRRWILTNFAFAFDGSGNPIKPFYQCFAVSQTSDPVSGGWYFYAVKMDTGGAGAPPDNTLNDYPKFGLWNDGCLYMGANGFNNSSGSYAGAEFASFNTADMYAGAGLTSALGFLAPDANSNPYSMFPANLLGTSSASMPPIGTPEYFVDESFSVYGMEVRKFTPGSNCGGGGTLSSATVVNVASYGYPVIISGLSYTTNMVRQNGTTNRLDSLGDRVMQRVQYRRIGSAESLWVVHTTCGSAQDSNGACASSTSLTRPQWMQIDVSGGTINTTPAQQQIYAPDSILYRWMGSLAVDGDGDMALGYSTSSGSAYPGIAYSGRLSTDPLNNLSQTETVLQSGAGSQTNSCGGAPCHRWGDYSAMSVDPLDDCTFWYTTEYYDSTSHGSSGTWQTRIGSFKFPGCAATVAYLVTATAGANGSITPASQNVDAGNSASFTVTPNTGYHVSSVTGDTCTVTLDTGNTWVSSAITDDCAVTASFAIDTYTLTYTAGANGAISGTSPQTVDYGTDGSAVTAVPDTGYHFVQWSDSSTANPRTDTNVMADVSVTATFAINTYTLTYTAGSNGSISGTSPQTVDYGTNGSAVTAVPDTGYHFVQWSDSSTANPRTDTNVMADVSVTATFAINTFTVTPSVSGGNGTIAPSTPQTVNYNATTAFTLTPNTGYHIDSVTGTCGGSLVGSTYTTNAVTADCTVIASFAIDTFTVTPSVSGGNGTIAPSTPQTVNYNATTAFTLAPNTGYHIASVSGTCGGSLVGSTYTTNAVTADCTVIASFAIDTFTVTPSVSGGNGTIAPSTPQTVNYNATTAFTLTPNTGYHIAGVSGTCGGSLAAGTFTTNAVTADCTVVATFAINTYALTYTAGANGSISGTSPQTVNYGASGSAVTAVPATGYHFVQWSDASTANPRTDTNVTAEVNVTATFAINTYTLTYTAGANGSISGTSPQTVDYGASGTAVTAVPATGYHFVQWSDASTANPRTDTNVTADVSVTATFAINTYTLTYTAGANGSISGTSPQTVNYGASGSAVTAVPATGYHFVQWSDASTANPRTDTNVMADVSVTATFAINTYTLTYTAGANGSISGTSPQTVNYGASGSAVTAVPATGYHFVQWSDSSTANPRTDTNVMSDVTVTASFAINTYTVSPSVGGGSGTISPSGDQSVNYSDTPSFTLTPSTGYHIDSVGGTCGGSLVGSTYTTNAVTADCTVIANFAVDRFTLTYSAGANGSISGTTPQTVDYGTSGSAVMAVPDAGYHFVQWSDASTANPRTDTNVTADVSVTATFAINTYTLTYSAGANGSISGTSPQTVNYGADGTTVTAVPATGYHFVQWSDSSTANPRTDTNVMADVNVTATFAINTYTLTYSAGANGSISGTSPQTVNYGASGSAVTAVPATGYHFVQWSDASTANPRTDTNVTADISVTATFAINAYTLTYTAGANGSISGTSPQTVDYGASGSAVTAVPATGYHFVQWSDASTANPRTDTNVMADVSVTATFAIDTFVVTPSVSGGNGTIAPNMPQTVDYNTTTAFTLTPNTGYHIANVGGTCGGSLVGSTYTTNAVTTDCTVVATFAINTYTLTYTAGSNGSITGGSPQTVNYGDDGSAVSAVPDTGYHFVQWSDASTANPRTDTNVQADVDVTAQFAANVLVFTTPPSDVAQGNALGTIAVSEQDGSGNTITDTATVDFSITTACGTVDLGPATMATGVATLTSNQRFYTQATGLTITATVTDPDPSPIAAQASTGFDVTANLDALFNDGFEDCRL